MQKTRETEKPARNLERLYIPMELRQIQSFPQFSNFHKAV